MIPSINLPSMLKDAKMPSSMSNVFEMRMFILHLFLIIVGDWSHSSLLDVIRG